MVFVYKKLAQFAVRGALPPRRSESPICATDNKPSCVLHLLGWFIESRGFSSLERRPEFWVLQSDKGNVNQAGYFEYSSVEMTFVVGQGVMSPLGRCRGCKVSGKGLISPR